MKRALFAIAAAISLLFSIIYLCAFCANLISGEAIYLWGYHALGQLPTTAQKMQDGILFGLLAVAFAILPVLWIKWFRKIRAAGRAGRCSQCGYDLRASTDRCPECGSPIPAKQESATI